VYRYDARGGTLTDTGWLPATADFTDIATADLRVPARDGTPIPLRVTHRKGLALDGVNPAILSGYGSNGHVPSRLFAPEMLAWYERGGVCASPDCAAAASTAANGTRPGTGRARRTRSLTSSTAPST
jgi:prolyl oligopeptidase